MKKRMLLVLALGISFAPAVFAGEDDLRSFKPHKTGELSFSEITEGQGAGCNLKAGKELRESGNSASRPSGHKAERAE